MDWRGATKLALLSVSMILFATAAAAVDVIEFYNRNLDHYFITADAAEAAAIDRGSAGPGWSRTGNTFLSGGSVPVCRFYGSQSPGPNSHFYTLAGSECDELKRLQSITPASQKRWNFERLDFSASRDTNGACPTGTIPVYRAYNRGATRGIDSNHRITTNLTAIQQQAACGWENEGVVMCAPNGVTSGGTTTCGGSTPVTAAAQLTPQDFVNLYPAFYAELLTTEIAFALARDMYNPLLGTGSLGTCDQGGISSDWPAGSLPRQAPVVAHVTYANCISIVEFTVPDTGQHMSIKLQKNGVVTYALDSFGGDFLTTRNAINANVSIGLSGFSQVSTITITGQAPLVNSQTLNGTYRWNYSAYDLNRDLGTVYVFNPAPLSVTATIAGFQRSSTIRPSHSYWNFSSSQFEYVTQFTRYDSEITLVGHDKFEGQDIKLTNLVPAVYPVSDPSAIIETDVSKIGVYSQPASGLEVLAYGVSRVYVTYLGNDLLMQLDLNGDGCIESSAKLTSKQLNDMLGSAGLPMSVLVPSGVGTCVPVPH